MKYWNERMLESTRGQIIQLLRRGEATVNELASALSLTDNGVRAHLATLERDGLVVQTGQRAGVRKPERLYGLTQSAEQLFPKAYHVLLELLLKVLDKELPLEKVEDILREVGRNLAISTSSSEGDLEVRLSKALEILEGLGGLAEIQEREGKHFICGYSCPLGLVASHHPEVCKLAESLLSEIIGQPVKNHCEYDPKPRCVFEVS